MIKILGKLSMYPKEKFNKEAEKLWVNSQKQKQKS